MKVLIISCLVALAAAAGNDAEAPIVKQAFDLSPDGSYTWAYETGNGIAADAAGHLEDAGGEAAVAAKGSYSYTGPDGVPVKLVYTADANGFQPQGSHLPTPPPPEPIPDYIQRSLDWIAAHPAPPGKN